MARAGCDERFISRTIVAPLEMQRARQHPRSVIMGMTMLSGSTLARIGRLLALGLAFVHAWVWSAEAGKPIVLRVDAANPLQHVFHVTEQIPVTPGALR